MVPWVGGAMATTVPIRSLMPWVLVTYRDWKPPSECPTIDTFAAPVADSTRPMNALISCADSAIGRRPPTNSKPGYAP